MARKVKSRPNVETVDPSTVEAIIKQKEIGQKIRRLRLKRSMGLAELGQQVGLSASFLSQLENGRVVPTMRNLARIAMAFKKDLAYFLQEEENATLFRISRSKDRIRLALQDKEAALLTSDNLGILLQDKNATPCIAEFASGGNDAAFHPNVFPGLELVYVISGALALSTDQVTEILYAKDSAWIDGRTTRQYRCHGDQPARAFIMTFAA